MRTVSNSLVESPDRIFSTKKVASAKSIGSRGSVAWSNWYGENPVTRLTVILSANTASASLLGHCEKSPLQDLTIASQRIKCPLSTTPFA